MPIWEVGGAAKGQNESGDGAIGIGVVADGYHFSWFDVRGSAPYFGNESRNFRADDEVRLFGELHAPRSKRDCSGSNIAMMSQRFAPSSPT